MLFCPFNFQFILNIKISLLHKLCSTYIKKLGFVKKIHYLDDTFERMLMMDKIYAVLSDKDETVSPVAENLTVIYGSVTVTMDHAQF